MEPGPNKSLKQERSPLQPPEKEILVYQQLPSTVEDDSATTGNALVVASRGKLSPIRVILGGIPRGDIKIK